MTQINRHLTFFFFLIKSVNFTLDLIANNADFFLPDKATYHIKGLDCEEMSPCTQLGGWRVVALICEICVSSWYTTVTTGQVD